MSILLQSIMNKSSLLFLFLVFPCFSLLAQYGTLDPTFGTNGLVSADPGVLEEHSRSLAIYPDGRFLVGGHHFSGSSSSVAYDLEIFLTRFHPDGTIDSTFGVNGTAYPSPNQTKVNESAISIVVLSNEELLVLASPSLSYDNPDLWIYNLNANGTGPGTQFGGIISRQLDFGAVDFGGEMARLPDGRLLICGTTVVGSIRQAVLIRLLPDGNFDTAFGTNGMFIWGNTSLPEGIEAKAIALLPDGKAIISGGNNLYSGFGESGLYLARIDTNGALDPGFGNGGDIFHLLDTLIGVTVYGEDIGLQSDGSLIVGGVGSDTASSAVDGMMVMKFDSVGQLDSTFGNHNGRAIYFPSFYDVDGEFLIVQPDNKIIIGGGTDYSDGDNLGESWVLRLESNGSLDNTWGTGGIGQVDMSIGYDEEFKTGLIQPDGKLLIVGEPDGPGTPVTDAYIGLVRLGTGVMSERFDPARQFGEIILYPNPVSEMAKLDVYLESGDFLSLHLYDVAGRRVHTFFQEESRTQGKHSENLVFPSDLSSQNYILHLTGRKGGSKSIQITIRD